MTREKCSFCRELNVFRDRIVTNLRDNEDDVRSAYSKVKKETTYLLRCTFLKDLWMYCSRLGRANFISVTY